MLGPPTPTKWDNTYLEVLFKYDWNVEKESLGSMQWVPVSPDEDDLEPMVTILQKNIPR